MQERDPTAAASGATRASPPGSLLDHIRQLPDLGEHSAGIEIELPDSYSKISNIVVSGMGGSGIAGDVARDAFDSRLDVPIITVRSPSLPAFVNRNTLFVSMSYSGNTFETVFALREAVRRGAKVVGISSGGKLEAELSRLGLPFLHLPSGYLPRETLPFFLFGLANVLSRLNKVDPDFDFESLRGRESRIESRAKTVAGQIGPETVTIYTKYASVGQRFKAQLNENAKAKARYDVFPELCRNEVNLWESSLPSQIVFFRDTQESEEMRRIIEASMKLLDQDSFIVVKAEGASRLERILHLIWTGDFISYYVAQNRMVDPVPIHATEHLKESLFTGGCLAPGRRYIGLSTQLRVCWLPNLRLT